MKSSTALAALLLVVAAPVPARDVGGVNIPDTLRVTGEKRALVLNGAGYRKKFFVQVYIGALYLVQPVDQVAAVLNATTPRVMRLQFLRDVSADRLAGAWNEGFAANNSAFEMKALRGRLDQFSGLMRDMKSGDVLRLDLLPRGETRVLVNDALRGSVDGIDFQRALLQVWLGARPADADLQQALLGAGGQR